jgi:hypothetical protein
VEFLNFIHVGCQACKVSRPFEESDLYEVA